jgi:hypothetical protein
LMKRWSGPPPGRAGGFAFAAIGRPLSITAKIELSRPRLIQTRAHAHDASGGVVAEATAKYVPLSADRNREFVKTLLDDPSTLAAADELRRAAAAT